MRHQSNNEWAAWKAYKEGCGPKPDSPTSFGRHERKCTICNHPDRELIELEFLRWYSPQDIARDHDLPYASAIYRHAHATGLFERRRRAVRFALEPLIEQATGVMATAGSVIRAIRTYAHIDNAGQWISHLTKDNLAKDGAKRRSKPPTKRSATKCTRRETGPAEASPQTAESVASAAEPSVRGLVTAAPNPNREI